MKPGETFDYSVPEPTDRHENTLETARSSELQWIRRLPAHGEISIEVQGKVGEATNERPKLTTTACVLADGKTRPMVCDSDSDMLQPGSDAYLFGIYTVLLVVVLAVGAWIWKRRNSRRSGNLAAAAAADRI